MRYLKYFIQTVDGDWLLVCQEKKIKNSCLSLFLISIVSEVREMSCDYGAKECPWKWIMKMQKQISKIKKKKGVVGCIESTINQLVSSQVDIEKAGTVELRALLFPICHFIQRVAEKSIWLFMGPCYVMNAKFGRQLGLVH